ncbi:MAG: carboxypeptidase regulatory-like domain-containing protein [Bacteroidales bacterium]
MSRNLRAGLAVLIFLAFAASASAQGWRGQGHVNGKVTDESGKPLEGVVVKMVLPSEKGAVDTKTDKKGEWSIGGIGRGNWQVDFEKPGFETRRIAVQVDELSRQPPIPTTMKVAAPDANKIIADGLATANGYVKERKFAEAQAVFADLLTKYPQAYQLELQIARAYDAEGDYDKEIEHLKKYIAHDPDNVAVKLLTGGVMIAKGNSDEGKALLQTIDDAKVPEAAVFVNAGITLLNKNKPKDALIFFEKAVNRFPGSPDGYYYRGVTQLGIGSSISADDKEGGAKLIQAGKADLTKFLAMAPNAPEAEAARKMLESVK